MDRNLTSRITRAVSETFAVTMLNTRGRIADVNFENCSMSYLKVVWRILVSTLSLVYINLTVMPNPDVFHIVVMLLCLLFCKT